MNKTKLVLSMAIVWAMLIVVYNVEAATGIRLTFMAYAAGLFMLYALPAYLYESNTYAQEGES